MTLMMDEVAVCSASSSVASARGDSAVGRGEGRRAVIPPASRPDFMASMFMPTLNPYAATTGAAGGAGAGSGAAATAAAAAADAVAMPAGLSDVMSPGSLPEGVSLRARFPSIEELRSFVKAQLQLIREDHLRPVNPTPYKVSVSTELFHFCHDLWMKEVPIPELE